MLLGDRLKEESVAVDGARDPTERLLVKILEPADLRQVPKRHLRDVCDELRGELIELGAVRGGHFAGSLGTVELTVGLHWVFDTPRDRLIWDVGHQAYGHKALTGRRKQLIKIKKAGGPSGFLRRCESEYDVFGAGHAGTSVSAGLGISEGLRRQDREGCSVAIIGDGAATSGMSFEALNHAGHLEVDTRVVYNDNGMSIAPSIGGLKKPGNARKYFESMGFLYIGPVDGHDLEELLPALEKLRDTSGPVVLHAVTQKGHGFAPAEADPYGWHACKPFDAKTGVVLPGSGKPSPPSWTQAFADSLAVIADRDPRVVAITAAMPDGTGLDSFERAHPDRVYDVGIAEQHAVTFAAGMATEGMRPVCAIYSTFLQRAFDQIVHDVALQNLPVTFAIDRAGLVGADGPTHHGVLDLGYLRMIPNLVIAAPRDENQLQHLLATAIESDRPFAVRFPRGTTMGVRLDPEPKAIPIGRAELLRDGKDVALFAIGKTVGAAEKAADLLAEQGILARVVDARFVKPLDDQALVSAAERCSRIVTIEDHMATGGFGSAVLERLAVLTPEARVLICGLADRFVEHGETDDQWAAGGIDPESIAARTADWLEKS
jgi:1-deoxy-D-xylulose-5-phosphate synthase